MNALTIEAVAKIFFDCLFKEGEPAEPRIVGEGVLHDFGFHPARLASHEPAIIALLKELPDQFHEGSGDGWSFLQGCVDRDGRQWGEHQNLEQLMALGNAIGRVVFLFPREHWKMLPGGVPYLTVLSQKLIGEAKI